MKSFIVMTYYHLMHAVALALTLEKKPNLYVSINYLKINDEMLERLRETNIFNEVIKIDNSEFVGPYIRELKTATSPEVFDKHLEPYFSKVFSTADFDEEIFVYNDFQYYYYYISKHFKNIVGVEDGYQALEQQTRMHQFKGDIRFVEPFIEKDDYPAPMWKNKNVKKIISSCSFDNLEKYYKDLIEVIDFYDLIEQNREQYGKALIFVFNMENISLKEKSALYLTQPLDRAQYCTSTELYLLNKKVIREEKNEGFSVYVKPHPAEWQNLNLLKEKDVEIFKGDFPVELFNYKGFTFERAITFGSTSIKKADYFKEKKQIFENSKAENDQVTDFIKDYIKEEKMEIDIYMTVDELTEEAYISAYSFLIDHNNINININLLVKEEDEEKAIEFFNIKEMKKNIKLYLSKSNKRENNLFRTEIKKLGIYNNEGKKNYSIKIIGTKNFSEEYIYKEYICINKNMDYFMIIAAGELGFRCTTNIIQLFRRKIPFAIPFLNYSISDGQKVNLGHEAIGNMYIGQLKNRLIHKSIKELIKGENLYDEFSITEAFRNMEGSIFPSTSIELSLETEKNEDILCQESQFISLIQDLNFKIDSLEVKAYEKKDKLKVDYTLMYIYQYVLCLKNRREKVDPERISRIIRESDLSIEEKEIALSKLMVILDNKENSLQGVASRNYDFYKYLDKLLELLIKYKLIGLAQWYVKRRTIRRRKKSAKKR